MHSPCILRIIFSIHTLFMCTNTLVCDEERSLTFAHWRSAAESERAALRSVDVMRGGGG